MKKLGFFALAAASSLALAAPAHATEYIGSQNWGGGSYSLSITTDGTTGVLGIGNVVDWTIVVTNPGGSHTLNGPLSGNDSGFTFLSGSSLTATSTQLLFDFDNGGGHFQFDDYGFGGSSAFCGASTGSGITCTGFAPQQTIGTPGDTTSSGAQGLFVLGEVRNAAVPEPGTWAMMLLGFGAMGWSFKRRRKLALA